jgi:hypothetical protein
MDEIDCVATYRELEQILKEFGLEWVTEQVAQTIREGKVIEDRDEKARGVTKTEEYTVREQLILLINAVEQAVVNTVEIENEIKKFLAQEETEAKLRPEIFFIPPDENRENFFKFSPRSLAQRKGEASELKHYLKILRSEVTNSVG